MFTWKNLREKTIYDESVKIPRIKIIDNAPVRIREGYHVHLISENPLLIHYGPKRSVYHRCSNQPSWPEVERAGTTEPVDVQIDCKYCSRSHVFVSYGQLFRHLVRLIYSVNILKGSLFEKSSDVLVYERTKTELFAMSEEEIVKMFVIRRVG